MKPADRKIEVIVTAAVAKLMALPWDPFLHARRELKTLTKRPRPGKVTPE
jgi:hypothetical protein